MRVFRLRLGLVFLLGLGLACGDSSQSGGSGSTGTILLQIVHQSAGAPLAYDQLIYINEAGNRYSVTKFEYLMTELELSGGAGAVELAEVVYGNAFDGGSASYTFENVPTGEYDGLGFWWGVPPFENETGALGPDYEGMSWPAQFGGGYHAMRLEGNWTELEPGDSAYALHAGHLRRCRDMMIPFDDCPELDRLDQTAMATIAQSGFSFQLDSDASVTIELVINVNNWMDAPVYNLGSAWSDQSICPFAPAICTLGFPTMPGPEPQQMMRENAGNVFSIGAIGAR